MGLQGHLLASSIRKIPLFRSLPKIELVKLLPDFRLVEAQEGMTIGDGDLSTVFFVISGFVKLYVYSGEEKIVMHTLGPSGIFGAMGGASAASERAEAISPVEVVALPAEKFAEVMVAQPDMAKQIIQIVSRRLRDTQQQLGRSRVMLRNIAEEIWDPTDSTVLTEEAFASLDPLDEHPPEALVRGNRTTWSHWLYYNRSWLVSLLTAGLVWFVLPVARDLHPITRLTFAILTWAASTWILSKVPEYAVAIGACIAFVLSGFIVPKAAFSGYADPTWFMILGVFGIGAAISRSGLLYRMALQILNRMPPSYKGQTLAMALTGLLVTPCLPSANARVALAGPLALEVSDGLGFSRRSNGTAGIGMSCLLGFGQMFFLFLNGTSSCLLVWGLLPPAVRQHVTWGFWFIASLPLGIITFLFSYLTIIKMLPVQDRRSLVSRPMLRMQLGLLGKMSWQEQSTLVVVIGVLVSFVLEPYHHIHPAWPAMVGFLVVTFLGIVDREQVKKAIDWNFMLLFGALISLATVTRATGVNDALTAVFLPILAPFTHHPLLFIPLLGLLVVVVRLAIPWQPAVMITLITLMPLAESAGYSPFLIGLVTLAMSNPYILPQQNTVYMTVHAGMEEAFDHKKIRRVAFAHLLVSIIGVAISVPYWHLLGLTP